MMVGRRPRAVIADDEPLLLEELRRMLAEIWPELEVVESANTGKRALGALQQHRPDVVFLDIRMPGLSGLEVAKAWEKTEGTTHLVFVTAYDRFAVDAFERGAADYLLKPLTHERLAATVARLKSALARNVRSKQDTRLVVREVLGELSKAPLPRLRWLRVGHRGQVRLVHVEDVICFRSEQKYTRVLTAEGSDLVRLSLRKIVEQLDPLEFWRVHRGTVINVRRLDAASRDQRGRYILRMKGLKEPLITSSKYGHLFRQM